MGIKQGALLLSLLAVTDICVAGESDYFNIYNLSNAQLDFGSWSIGMGGAGANCHFLHRVSELQQRLQ